MNEFDINSENKEKELEDQLKKLPKEKWKIWRLIVVGIITPFVGPYIPMKNGMLVDRMGYQDSVFDVCCYFFNCNSRRLLHAFSKNQ